MDIDNLSEYYFLHKRASKHKVMTQKVENQVFKNDAISLDRIQILHFSGSQIDQFGLKAICFIMFSSHAKYNCSGPLSDVHFC